MRKGLHWLAPLLTLAACLALRLWNPAPVTQLQMGAFDTFQRLRPRPYQAVPVRVVDIDEESLRRFGQWPWPRTLVAQLLRRLREAGAAAVGFDMVFPEPDRTSPFLVSVSWPQPVKESLVFYRDLLPDHDRVLARTIADSPVVTGLVLSHQGNPPPALKAGFAASGESPEAHLDDFPAVVRNLPPLDAAAAGIGHLNLSVEADGMVRRVPLIARVGGELIPALSAEMLRVGQGAAAYIIKTAGGSGELSFGARTGVTQVKVGSLILPTDAHGRMWFYDSGAVAERTIPAWQVLAKEAPAGSLVGAAVVIGTSAAGLKDMRATPTNPAAAGVEVHAQLIEQAVSGQFLRRPDWAEGAELFFIAAISLLLWALLGRIGPMGCALLSLLAIGGACGASWQLFLRGGLLLDPVLPSASVLLVYLVASLGNFLRTENERRRIRQSFGFYLAPALVERLAAHPEELRLGGETRNMTVLFSDIRGFTTLSERLKAETLGAFMNSILTPLTEQVLAGGGTIDKYIGDCVMAFWNAPLNNPAHARQACEAALQMQAALARWNRDMRSRQLFPELGDAPIRIGVGINSGDCVVGNFGAAQRFAYSVLGDPVNLASRIEGQTKLYGADILLGESTAAAVADFALLEVDRVVVSGKTEAVALHALIGAGDEAVSSGFQEWRRSQQELLAAYRGRRWQEALDRIAICRGFAEKRGTLEEYYRSMEERIRRYQANPPPSGWDGAIQALGK